MPAGAKMSIASMKAEPMMPNMSVTPLATRVSTKASDGVIFCTPVTAARVVATAAVMLGRPPRFGIGFHRMIGTIRFRNSVIGRRL